jgi:hypothetical protein
MVDATDLSAVTLTLTLPGPGATAAPVTSATSYQFTTNCGADASTCPAIAVMQLPCNLNNKLSANTQTFRTGWNYATSTPYTVAPKGIASVIAFQTDPTSQTLSLCSATPANDLYGPAVLGLGLNNGAQVLEVSTQEATKAECQPDLSGELLKLPIGVNCDYAQ